MPETREGGFIPPVLSRRRRRKKKEEEQGVLRPVPAPHPDLGITTPTELRAARGNAGLRAEDYGLSPEQQRVIGEIVNNNTSRLRRYLLQGPRTTISVAVSPETKVSMAVGEAMDWVSGIYGENVTPWLQASFEPDPRKRQAALDFLAKITKSPYISVDNTAAENVQAVLLSPLRKSILEAAKNQQPATQALLEAVSLLSLENYEEVLGKGASRKVIENIKRLKGELGPMDPLRLEINEEWARAHPTKLLAMSKLIRMRFPDAEIAVGERGILGDTFHGVLEALGRPLDWLTSPVSTALRYAGEYREAGPIPGEDIKDVSEAAVKAIGSKPEEVPGDYSRISAARQAQRLREKLSKGELPPEKWQDALQDLAHLEDLSEFDPGGDVWEVWRKSAFPEVGGFGIGESFADSINVLPGDPAYGAVVGSISLGFGIGLDPWLLGGAVVRGARISARQPLRVVGGKKPALTANNLADAAKAGSLPTAQALSRRSWAFFGGMDEPSRLARYFERKGLRASRTGDGVFVYGLNTDDAVNLGHRFRPNVLHTSDGIVDVPRKAVQRWRFAEKYASGEETRVIQTPAGGVTVGLINDPVSLIAPQMSRSAIAQGVIQRTARTTDELMRGLEPRKVMTELRELLAAVPANRRLGLLTEAHPWMEAPMARALESAARQGVDEMLEAWAAVSRGGWLEPVRHWEVQGRLAEIAEDLNGIRGFNKGILMSEGEFTEFRGALEDPALVTKADEVEQAIQQRQMTRAQFYAHMGMGDGEFGSALQRAGWVDDVNTDLLGEQVFLRDLVKTNEVTLGVKAIPDKAFLRQIKLLSPDEAKWTPTEKLLYAAAGGPNQAANFLKAYRSRWLAALPGARPIYLPATPVAEMTDQLVNAHTLSAKTIRDLGLYLGVPNNTIQEVLTSYAEAWRKGDAFLVAKNLFEKFAENSTKLDEVGKDWLRHFSHTTISERTPAGVLNAAGDFEPTLFRPIERRSGLGVDKMGMPAFSGDFMKPIWLPSRQMFEEYTTLRGRLRQKAKIAEKGGRKLAYNAYETSHNIITASTNFWKAFVLIGRMPLALLSRIQLEQHLRIAGADYASAVSHPVSWLRAVKPWNMEKFARFADSPVEALGSIVDWTKERTRVLRPDETRVTRQYLTPNETDPLLLKDYFNGVSVLASRRYISPEVRRYLTMTPEEALDWLGKDKLVGPHILRNITNSGIDPVRAIERMQDELKAIAGGNEHVEAALRTGTMKIGDEAYEVGSVAFGRKLQEMYDVGKYTPTVRVNAGFTSLAHDADKNFFEQIRGFMFRNFYSKPDVYLSRSPLFRQIAKEEFDRLRNLGWKTQDAEKASIAHGAEATADYMYEIGAHTGGQNWLRNVAPFFPAWQELSETWLLKVPLAQGGPVIGHAVLARKAQLGVEFMKQTGILGQNEQGEWFFTIPGVDQVLGNLFGFKEGTFRLSARSLAGILPIPGVGQMLPGLGPWPSAVLSLFAKKFDGVIDDIANVALPFGNNVNLGPQSVNNLFYALGQVPFWEEHTTGNWQRARMNFAAINSIRQIMSESGIKFPKFPDRSIYTIPADYEQAVKDYRIEYKAKVDEVLAEATQRTKGHYFIQSVMSLLSPVSGKWTSDHEAEMAKIWNTLSVYEDGSPVRSALLSSFQASFPEASQWSTSKTIRKNLERTTEFDQFVQQFNEGQVRVLTPEEFIKWNLGIGSYYAMVNARQAELDLVAQTAPDMLLHGAEKREILSRHGRNWAAYLKAHPDFEKIFNEYTEARKEAYEGQQEETVSIEQQLTLDALDGINAISHLFTLNGRRNGDYKAIRRELVASLEGGRFGPPKGEMAKGLSWWYTTVADPYYNSVDNLYNRAAELPKQYRGPIYEKIRSIADAAKPQKGPDGRTYPTPEEVSFGILSQNEQTDRLAQWAALPVEWLTTFQRSKVSLPSGAKSTKLYSLVNREEERFDEEVARKGLSTSSNDYLELDEAKNKRIRAWAEKNGAVEALKVMNRLPYEKLASLNPYRENPTFKNVVAAMDKVKGYVESYEYQRGRFATLGGASKLARYYQFAMFEAIDKAREEDPEFNTLMEGLEIALADEGDERKPGDDLYFELFFGNAFVSAPRRPTGRP